MKRLAGTCWLKENDGEECVVEGTTAVGTNTLL